jgi:hypothetical protein
VIGGGKNGSLIPFRLRRPEPFGERGTFISFVLPVIYHTRLSGLALIHRDYNPK